MTGGFLALSVAGLVAGALSISACSSIDARPGLDRQECDIALRVLGPIIRQHIAGGGQVVIASRMRLNVLPGTDENTFWDRVRAMGFAPSDRTAETERLLRRAYFDEMDRLRAQSPGMDALHREMAAWSHAHETHGDDRSIPSDDLWSDFHDRNARPSRLRCRAELARAGPLTIHAPGADLPADAILIEVSRAGFSRDAREALIQTVVTRHPETGPGPLDRTTTLWRMLGGWPLWRVDAGRTLEAG